MHRVTTIEDAIAVYWDTLGDGALIPAHQEKTPYDDKLGGWLFENVNGPLALVRDDGSLADVVYDDQAGDWRLAD